MANPTQAPTGAAATTTASPRTPQPRGSDPLAPGSGTPWEDRGSIGFVAAFVKTVIAALTRPGTLLESMRRPETPADGRMLSIVCGVFWGLGWVVHDLVAFRAARLKDVGPSGEPAALDVPVLVLHFALGIVATWGLFTLVTHLAYKLISAGEMRTKFPHVLLYNVYAYALAPSVLAVIPVAGPWLAIVWIFALFVYGARARLLVKLGGAIVCNIFAVVGVLGLAAAAYFTLAYLYNWLYAPPLPPDVIKTR